MVVLGEVGAQENTMQVLKSLKRTFVSLNWLYVEATFTGFTRKTLWEKPYLSLSFLLMLPDNTTSQ